MSELNPDFSSSGDKLEKILDVSVIPQENSRTSKDYSSENNIYFFEGLALGAVFAPAAIFAYALF